MTYDFSAKKEISDLMGCATIGQFEDNVLKWSTQSGRIDKPTTDYDQAMALDLASKESFLPAPSTIHQRRSSLQPLSPTQLKSPPELIAPSNIVELRTPSGKVFKLPVGVGITPIIWNTYDQETKKTIANHFQCATIGQFEDEILKLSNALVESELTAVPGTESDYAIAQEMALSESEDTKSIESDRAIAVTIANEETAHIW